MEKGLSFEKAMERMEEIIALLEDGELTLDKSLETFEEGIVLYKYLTKQLGKAEGRIKLIIEDEDEGIEKTDFELKGDRGLGL